MISKLGEVVDRFGDDLCVDCTNLICISGHNQFTNTKLTKPTTNISKSIDKAAHPPLPHSLRFTSSFLPLLSSSPKNLSGAEVVESRFAARGSAFGFQRDCLSLFLPRDCHLFFSFNTAPLLSTAMRLPQSKNTEYTVAEKDKIG